MVQVGMIFLARFFLKLAFGSFSFDDEIIIGSYGTTFDDQVRCTFSWYARENRLS